MDKTIGYLLLTAVVCLIVIVIVLMFMVVKQRRDSEKTISRYFEVSQRALIAQITENNKLLYDSLLKFNNTISGSLRADFDRMTDNTNSYLAKFSERVNESLLKGFDKSEKIFSTLNLNMGKIDSTQNDLKELTNELLNVKMILADKKLRGIYGEIELYSLLKSIYGDDESFYRKQYRFSNGHIADAVILAADPLGKIAIDSKFPLESYQKMMDEKNDQSQRDRAKIQFRKDVIKHIDDIAARYLIKGETADMAYMFIPAEAIFEEIYAHYDDVVAHSYECHVYLVSPTTLMAYLSAIKAIYLGVKKDERVKDIQIAYLRLAKEFNRYLERFNRLDDDFERLSRDFHDIKITNDKITKRFQDIEQVKFTQGDKYEETDD